MPLIEGDPTQRIINSQPNTGLGAAEFGLAGAAVVGIGTLLVAAPNALANNVSSADAEKQALAAFGPNAITRSIDSFDTPSSVGSTSLIETASVSYEPATDQPPANETPPTDENPPDNSNLSPDELKKLCKDTGLSPPETVYSYMTQPGSSGGRPQYVHGRFLYKLMPDVCKDKYKRFASFLTQIKDKGSNRWRNLTNSGKKYWDSLQIDETGQFLDANKQGEAVGDFLLGPSGHGVTADKNGYYYNKDCRPVRTFIRTRVVKNKPRRVHDIEGQPGLYHIVYPKVGEKFKKVAVELLGKCAKKKN